MRFPGQRYDAATGLNYNYFRDYDAGSGRYVQSDPIGLAGGISTYGYAGGNSLLAKDPFGLVAYVCRKGNGIGITIPVNFMKYSGTTDAMVDDIVSQIEGFWTRRVGEYDVRLNVIKVGPGGDVNNVTVHPWREDRMDAENLYLHPGDYGNIYAHEAGHWMGLPNRFGDIFKNNVMSYMPKEVWEIDIEEILSARNKGVRRVFNCECR
jgi:RHS repeat-associated protein